MLKSDSDRDLQTRPPDAALLELQARHDAVRRTARERKQAAHEHLLNLSFARANNQDDPPTPEGIERELQIVMPEYADDSLDRSKLPLEPAIFRYVRFRAETSVKHFKLRPDRHRGSKLDRKRAIATHCIDSDDLVQDLVIEIIEQLRAKRFRSVNEDRQVVPLSFWVNAIFAKKFGRGFRQRLFDDELKRQYDSSPFDDEEDEDVPDGDVVVKRTLGQVVDFDLSDWPADPAKQAVLRDVFLSVPPHLAILFEIGMKQSEIARHLGLSPKALSRELAKLTAPLRELGFTKRETGRLRRKKRKHDQRKFMTAAHISTLDRRAVQIAERKEWDRIYRRRLAALDRK